MEVKGPQGQSATLPKYMQAEEHSKIEGQMEAKLADWQMSKEQERTQVHGQHLHHHLNESISIGNRTLRKNDLLMPPSPKRIREASNNASGEASLFWSFLGDRFLEEVDDSEEERDSDELKSYSLDASDDLPRVYLISCTSAFTYSSSAALCSTIRTDLRLSLSGLRPKVALI